VKFGGTYGDNLTVHRPVDIGDITTLTVKEFLALDRWPRLKYPFYRNPVVMFGSVRLTCSCFAIAFQMERRTLAAGSAL